LEGISDSWEVGNPCHFHRKDKGEISSAQLKSTLVNQTDRTAEYLVQVNLTVEFKTAQH
jgi:hypothetical protein